MGTGTKVQYIGVMGEPPSTRTFPNRKFEPHLPNGSYSSTVTVVTDHDKNYNQTFSLYGRIDGSKQWIKIGNYTGNNDCFTEVVNDISKDIPDSITFRYLKVVPITYTNYPSMRFGLYGDPKDIEPETVNRAETVRYTVTYRSEGGDGLVRSDPYIYGCRCEWCRGVPDGNRRMKVKDLCRQYKKMYCCDKESFMNGGY